ncbi:hypothetical protein KIW84_024557 [Lathyrus oleraceus]|uniref:Uncharacterized protein n=1 Tax=Pisum sativum TaxID=3888 RepID=A0A9D5BCW9_PEA|nr:hypothetical protein KIW84_024557 [Pisum sativum]
MHVQMVTLLVTFGSVDQSPIYESDLWSFIAETPECCPSYLSVGIRLFQDSPGRFRGLWVFAQRLSDGDDGVSVSSVYFGTLELDLWLHIPSDGIIARARRTVPLHSTRPHRYFTRRNTPRLMDLSNTDILELKDKMNELINIMQGFAVGQKALADKVEKLERASAANSGVNLDGVSNQGLGGSRDGGKRATVGMANNTAEGFGAVGGQPGQNLKNSLFPPFFGVEDDREEDREADQFSMHNEPFGQYSAPPQNKEIQLLAEKIRALESYATPGVVNMSNMGLVEGIVIPQKFKAPAFDRYNGSSCPETHLQAFVRKISAYTMDQKLWMYFFQDSLSGGSLEWYTKLKS